MAATPAPSAAWSPPGYLELARRCLVFLWAALRLTVRLACRVAAGWWRARHGRTVRWGGEAFGVVRHVHRGRRQPVWWSATVLYVPIGRQR